MAEEITLIGLLDQSKNGLQLIKQSVNILKQAILELQQAIQQIDNITVIEKDTNNKYELIKYKSLILKLKAEHQKDIDELEKRKKELLKVINILERVIQLKTGDIF